MIAVSFKPISRSCATERAQGRTGQDWAALGQASSERSSGCIAGGRRAEEEVSSSASFAGNNLDSAWRKELLLSRNDTRARPRPRPNSWQRLRAVPPAAARLPAVPCRAMSWWAPRVSLSFLCRLFGAARGQQVFFLDSPLPLTPATWQGASWCARGTPEVLLPGRYCHADAACRRSLPTQPLATLGASVAGLLHLWDALGYLAIPGTPPRRGLGCAWVVWCWACGDEREISGAIRHLFGLPWAPSGSEVSGGFLQRSSAEAMTEVGVTVTSTCEITSTRVTSIRSTFVQPCLLRVDPNIPHTSDFRRQMPDSAPPESAYHRPCPTPGSACICLLCLLCLLKP